MQRLPVLAYGRILSRSDPLFPELPDQQALARQLRLLARCCRVLPVNHALDCLRQQTLPPRAACLSFDGAHAEHASVVMPVLRQLGLSATLFIPPEISDGRSTWRDAIIALVRHASGPRLALARGGFGRYDISCVRQRRSVIDTLLCALSRLPASERMARVRAMTRLAPPPAPGLAAEQVLALHRAGLHIGALGDGRGVLETLLQWPVRLYASADGAEGGEPAEPGHAKHVRAAGFDSAFTQYGRSARILDDPYALPRLALSRCAGPAFLLRLVRHALPAPRAQALASRWQPHA